MAEELTAKEEVAAPDLSAAAAELESGTEELGTLENATLEDSGLNELSVEPGKNQERSNLGRKLKAQGELIEGIAHGLETLTGVMTQLVQNQTQSPQPNAAIPGVDPYAQFGTGAETQDDYAPATKAELDMFLDQRESLKTQQQQMADRQYGYDFKQSLIGLGAGLSPQDKAIITNTVLTNPAFMTKHTGNAAIDAQMNFTNAHNALLKSAMGKTQNPLSGGQKQIGLGGATKQATPGSEKKTTPLTSATLNMLSALGKDEEWASKVLTK